MNDGHLDSLIDAHLNGTISDAERSELDAVLLESAEARRRFWQLAEVHGLARQAARIVWGEPAEPEADRVIALPPAKWRGLLSTMQPWQLAAALVVATSIAFFWSSAMWQTRSNELAGYVATITQQADCQWGSGFSVADGNRLAPRTLELKQGRAVLNFDGGARMVLVGPAKISIESAAAARVSSGKVVVRAAEKGAGFRLTTPEGVVVDVGTEFMVSVGKAGATECHVLSGEVEWFPKNRDSEITELTEGEARRFDDGKETKVTAEKTAFRDYLPPAEAARPGELTARESFKYPKANISIHVANGGKGWRSAWRPAPNANGKWAAAIKLNFDPPLPVPTGMKPAPKDARSLKFIATHYSFRDRALPQPIDFGKDGLFYFSFLHQCGTPEVVTKHPAGYNRNALTFGLQNSAKPNFRYADFSIGPIASPMIHLRGARSTGGLPLKHGEIVFVVCKIVTSKAGLDQMFMKVYRQAEAVEPAETADWTVVSEALALDGIQDDMRFCCPPTGAGRLGELRLGTSWRAVVPMVLPKR